MNTHVFVVDQNTFKIHLEYMFAGTGSRADKTCFLYGASAYCHASVERKLVSMIADISRISIGDNIIFYLQANATRQGKFYGVFTAKSKAFFDENDEENYLKKDLKKGLSFRILIERSRLGVFPEGITERELLDDITDKKHPYELCWSLIYRKLKGNRGCTMIMEYEFQDLLKKLKRKNNNNYIESNSYSFNLEEGKIVNSEYSVDYLGRQSSLSIKERLLYKANKKNAFETHLQAYIIQNINNMNILPLSNIEYWIGNEVACGVGMQRIDILIKQEREDTIYFKVIELKGKAPDTSIIDYQLNLYINWILAYVVPNYPNKQIRILPCIVAPRNINTSLLNYISQKDFGVLDSRVVVEKTEYIAFTLQTDNIIFNKIL